MHVKTSQAWQEAVVGHAGWLTSLLIAVAACATSHDYALLSTALITAAEACVSDVCQAYDRHVEFGGHWFRCGNFGLVLLNSAWAAAPEPMKDILEKMAEVTMVRGAQSGGVLSLSSRVGNL